MTGRGRKSCFTSENKGMEGIDNLLQNSRIYLAHDANTCIPGGYKKTEKNKSTRKFIEIITIMALA